MMYNLLINDANSTSLAWTERHINVMTFQRLFRRQKLEQPIQSLCWGMC